MKYYKWFYAVLLFIVKAINKVIGYQIFKDVTLFSLLADCLFLILFLIKISGELDVSWWLVFSPWIIEYFIYLFSFILGKTILKFLK